MRILVIGDTGMLGSVLVDTARKTGLDVAGASRGSKNIPLNICNKEALENVLRDVKPKVVVNCAAVTNFGWCEEFPEIAYKVNTMAPGWMAELCRGLCIKLIHISTDQYWHNEGDHPHREEQRVQLLSEYARSKYAGEQLVLTNPNSLVVRTNIVGFKQDQFQKNFAEWAFDVIENKIDSVLFHDYYTSSIDVYQFSEILLGLIQQENSRHSGVVNIASSDIWSKATFVHQLAIHLKKEKNIETFGTTSARDKLINRATSCGLDVTKIQDWLGLKMPTGDQVISRLRREKEKLSD